MTRRRWIDVLLGAGLVGVVLGYMQLGWRPMARARAELRTRVEQTESEILRSEHFTAGVEDLQRYLAEFEEALAELDRRVPERVDENDLARDATLSLRAHDLHEEAVQPGPPRPLGAITAHSVTVKLVGPYDRVVRFLHDVEALPRYTRVTRLAIEPDVERAGDLRVEVDLTSYSIGGGEA